METQKPQWVFNLYCSGRGDTICASDPDLPISRPRRLFWQIRGSILQWMFGWWRYDWQQIPEGLKYGTLNVAINNLFQANEIKAVPGNNEVLMKLTNPPE